MLALDYLIPNHPECVALVQHFAQGMRGYGGEAGQHWVLKPGTHNIPFLEGIEAFRVLVPRHEEAYVGALLCLTAVDIWCLRAARQRRLRQGKGPFAPLYESGVYYRDDEPEGQEHWLSTDALYQTGYGDCEDLACARAAERLSIGDHCTPCLELQPGSNEHQRSYHVLICNPDGTREDPSERLGMEG